MLQESAARGAYYGAPALYMRYYAASAYVTRAYDAAIMPPCCCFAIYAMMKTAFFMLLVTCCHVGARRFFITPRFVFATPLMPFIYFDHLCHASAPPPLILSRRTRHATPLTRSLRHAIAAPSSLRCAMVDDAAAATPLMPLYAAYYTPVDVIAATLVIAAFAALRLPPCADYVDGFACHCCARYARRAIRWRDSGARYEAR